MVVLHSRVGRGSTRGQRPALARRGHPGELEVGYWICSDRARRGYATEAAGLLTDAAFNSALDVGVVRISMDRDNHASAAVPRRLGFVFDQEYARERGAPGHSGRAIAWTMGRADWPARRPSKPSDRD